jgi:hypothetical protein
LSYETERTSFPFRYDRRRVDRPVLHHGRKLVMINFRYRIVGSDIVREGSADAIILHYQPECVMISAVENSGVRTIGFVGKKNGDIEYFGCPKFTLENK